MMFATICSVHKGSNSNPIRDYPTLLTYTHKLAHAQSISLRSVWAVLMVHTVDRGCHCSGLDLLPSRGSQVSNLNLLPGHPHPQSSCMSMSSYHCHINSNFTIDVSDQNSQNLVQVRHIPSCLERYVTHYIPLGRDASHTYVYILYVSPNHRSVTNQKLTTEG